MEEKFIAVWAENRKIAAENGVRMRPVEERDAMKQANRILSGHKPSDGFYALAEKGLLMLSLEALAVDKRFTGLFNDAQANNALTRLLEAGYRF